MSGMDRLSDDKLKRMADGLFNALEMQLLDDLGSMARELLAHRRSDADLRGAADKVRHVAAQLSSERVQGWANPLVCDLGDAADMILARAALTQSRAAAHTEGWNAAIEAAGNLESIEGYSNAVPRHRIRALKIAK